MKSPLHNYLDTIFFIFCSGTRFFFLAYNLLVMSSLKKQLPEQNLKKSANQSSYAEGS